MYKELIVSLNSVTNSIRKTLLQPTSNIDVIIDIAKVEAQLIQDPAERMIVEGIEKK